MAKYAVTRVTYRDEHPLHPENRMIRNPFRDAYKAQNFLAAVWMFKQRHRNLFNLEGQPHRLSGLASPFWRGYFGEVPALIPRDSLAWTYYRAGQACRREYNLTFAYTGRAFERKAV